VPIQLVELQNYVVQFFGDVFQRLFTARLLSDIVDFNYMSGTSMAAPHVAGVAALLLSAKPAATVQQVIEAIKDTASHPAGSDLRPDNRWGMGLIQPAAALEAI